MRIAEPQISRRGAFLFVALFSCLQITLGFFLINGNGHDSVLSAQIDTPTTFAEAPTIDEMEQFTLGVSSIEPAAGFPTDASLSDALPQEEDQDIINQKLIEALTTLSTKDSGEQ